MSEAALFRDIAEGRILGQRHPYPIPPLLMPLKINMMKIKTYFGQSISYFTKFKGVCTHDQKRF